MINLQPNPPGETNHSRISARTHREVMDWSLVLASQGIETIIDFQMESGWALLVPEAEHARAVSSIEQYQRENRHWGWHKTVVAGGLLFDWASAVWVALIGIFFWLSSRHPLFRESGIMDAPAVMRGEWWRLFTAEFLHADLLHLSANAVFGFVLLGLAMGRYGAGVSVLATFLAGTIGNLTSWLVHGELHRGLGASGIVMGALGLLAVQSAPLLKNRAYAWRIAATSLAGAAMLFVLLGVSPGTDVLAHLGGFFGGIFSGFILMNLPRLTKSPSANVAAGLTFAALVIWTWLLALR